MTIFRTAGAWGAGKGSNLTAAEVDTNFYDFGVLLEDLDTSRPQPDNFASVSIAGTQITFTLVSGGVFTVDLPVLKWRFRGDWAAFTIFAALDTFKVEADGLYMVLAAHTSAATFDPAAIGVGATVTAGAFIVDAAYTILTVGTTDFTLIGASANTIGVVFTATGVGTGTGTATTNVALYYQLLGLDLDLFAAGVADFLAAPSSANLAAAMTDETGTGALVFASSPALAGTPTAPTAAPGTNNTQVATTAYADAAATAIIAAADAMVFKGVLDCSTNPNYPAANRGETYRVSVAGKIGGASGPNVEAGDLLTCLTDGTASGTHAAVGASWTISQTNLDGAVIGPASAVDGRIAAFDGTTGKLLKDGGIATSALATFGLVTLSATVALTDGDSGYVVSPVAGDITRIDSVLLGGAVTTNDAIVTAKIGAVGAGVAVTTGVITITAAGSAIGDKDTASPTAARTVAAGDLIYFTVSGTPGGSRTATVSILITQ